MKYLIKDLLGYSQLAHRGFCFENLSLAEITKEVIDDLEVQIVSTKGSIQIGELPAFEADKIHMRQLFQNLISNG